MLQVRLREKGQVTIPAEVLQEWGQKHQVGVNDLVDVSLANGVLMLIPSKRLAARRDMMSFAGVGKGLWGSSDQEIEGNIAKLRESWSR